MLIALPFNEAQADLKFAAINRLGVVHPGWYVATVYAVKLRHNIFLAMRTIHSFPVVRKSRLCARHASAQHTGFALDLLRLSGWRRCGSSQASRASTKWSDNTI